MSLANHRKCLANVTCLDLLHFRRASLSSLATVRLQGHSNDTWTVGFLELGRKWYLDENGLVPRYSLGEMASSSSWPWCCSNDSAELSTKFKFKPQRMTQRTQRATPAKADDSNDPAHDSSKASALVNCIVSRGETEPGCDLLPICAEVERCC